MVVKILPMHFNIRSTAGREGGKKKTKTKAITKNRTHTATVKLTSESGTRTSVWRGV